MRMATEKSPHRQRGSSLIEVMIAFLVLAIGLLGILGMQIKSMQYNQSASTYAKAMNIANDIANDIAERIRINPKNVAAYTSTTIPETAPTSCLGEGFATVACSATELVKWDLFNWSQNLKGVLPSGSGSVSMKTQGTINYIQIIVSFDDSRSNENGAVSRKQYTLLVESPTQLGGA